MGRLPAPLSEDGGEGLGTAALYEIIENQLRDGAPAAVQATLARLVDGGMPRADAVHYIACVLSVELFEILVNDGVFDEERYAAHLAGLPVLPYEDAD